MSLLTKLKHMAPSTRYRVILSGTTFALGSQILSARQAIAHKDHYKTEETEKTASSADSEQPGLSSEPATSSEKPDQEVAPASKTDSLSSEANASSTDQQLNNETAVQAVSATQEPVNTSSSGLFNSLSIGLGETLLAFIVIGPFLLRSWKKRSQV